MKDRYFEAYEAALQSVPEKQRASLVNLISAHGLRPDDPMIVGSVFTHMLLARVDSVLTNLESATNPKRVGYSVSVLRTLAAALDKSKSLAPVLALIAILCSLGVGYTVHRADRFEEHDRVCAAATLALQRFQRQYIDYRDARLETALKGKPPTVCP